MGGEVFTTYAEGTDVAAAFRAAVEQAQYDYGHAGYTGTIVQFTDLDQLKMAFDLLFCNTDMCVT